jgi:hypothetical protein
MNLCDEKRLVAPAYTSANGVNIFLVLPIVFDFISVVTLGHERRREGLR